MQKLAKDAENQLIYLFKSPKNLEPFIAENQTIQNLPSMFQNPLEMFL